MHICRLQSNLETNENLVEICTGAILCYVYFTSIGADISLKNNNVMMSSYALPEMPFFPCRDINSETLILL